MGQFMGQHVIFENSVTQHCWIGGLNDKAFDYRGQVFPFQVSNRIVMSQFVA